MNAFIEAGVVNRYAFIEDRPAHPFGRSMVYTGPEDVDGVILMAFTFQSKSRPGKRQYKLLLDPFTMQTCCGCEFKQIHRQWVDVMNLPSPCCWHLRHLALWVKRKANKQKIEDMRLALEHYYQTYRKEKAS